MYIFCSLLTVPENVWNGPTIRPMVALFDNYHKNVIRPEFGTPSVSLITFNYISSRIFHKSENRGIVNLDLCLL